MSGFEIPAQEEFTSAPLPTDTAVFVDPAVFIFANAKYHDCYVTVSDNGGTNVDKFGVVSAYLITQSSVFRGILEDKMADFNNITINNISPAIFKLMLVHMYGGKLPKVDGATMAQLALAAHMYNVQYLVEEACRRLVPTSVDDVFPALVCAAHLATPSLLPSVTKIIQENTAEVVNREEFLKIDTKCLDFIVSLEKLSIGEIELRKALVKWGGDKAQAPRETGSALVTPTDQLVEKRTQPSVTNNNAFGCCEDGSEENPKPVTTTKQRQYGVDTSTDIFCQPPYTKRLLKLCLPADEDSNMLCFYMLASEYKLESIFMIKPSKPVEIETLIIYAGCGQYCLNQPRMVDCSICVTRVDGPNDTLTMLSSLQKIHAVVPNGREISLPVKFSDGSPLTLEAGCTYNIGLSFLHPLEVFRIVNQKNDDINAPSFELDGFTLSFIKSYGHLRRIGYKV